MIRLVVIEYTRAVTNPRRSIRSDKYAFSSFSVALLEPEYGINLGYLARTMANFGLRQLIVVSPHRLDGERLSQARRFASHGRDIVDKMMFTKSLDTLRKRFSLLIGTTAIEGRRKSNITRKTYDVEECASRVSRRVGSSSGHVCIVFGRDTTGMTNEELRKCDYNITIRTGSDYNTLNVSHCAAIVFFVFSRNFTKGKNRSGGERFSSRRARDRAILLFEKLAEDSEFQKFKSGRLREALSRLFNRGDPSLREIYLLMGLASKASSKIERLSSKQGL